MIRLFSLTICFQQNLLTALVSLCGCGKNARCQVRYIDNDIQSIIPEHKLCFQLADVLNKPKPSDFNWVDELLACTNKAITDYLKMT